MMEPPLRTENFGRRYRRRQPWAIRDLTLEIPAGSITALVGPNGSGKTTLIRACLGFEPANEGRVLVYGIDPQRDRPRAVTAIGYIPQSTSLYRGLTVGDHLTMATAARPTFDRAYAESRVRDAGLTQRRIVSELSGGEQAQVALALALGIRAPLLLLDEPLASLDPLARRDFLAALVVDVRNRGATALLSSHLVTDIAQTCDRLVVLTDGRKALDAGLAEVTTDFCILPVAELNGRPVVGTFAGPSGEPLALIKGKGIGRPPTLEEVVLGHLAAERTHRAEAA